MTDQPDNKIATIPSSTIAGTDVGGIAEMLSAMISISGGGTYHEPSCPFCCSPKRAEAEKIWNSSDIMAKNSEERISAFFLSVNENISPSAVKNHVQNHMAKGDMELRKVEYLTKIASLSGINMSTMDQIKIAMAMVIECLASTPEISGSKGMSAAKARDMRSGAVTKLVKTWVELMTLRANMLGEMEKNGEVLVFPSKGFENVFDKALTNAKTEGDRAIIHGLLKDLSSLAQSQA